MNQPTFQDGPPVPMMIEAVLDERLLADYLHDLREHARIELIREKGDAMVNSLPQAGGLEEVAERLRLGTVRALQIRYTFEDQMWSDSLFALAGGFKLVRCRHEVGGH